MTLFFLLYAPWAVKIFSIGRALTNFRYYYYLHDGALRPILQAAGDVVDDRPHQDTQGHEHRPPPGADVLGLERLHDHHGPLHRHQHGHVDGTRVGHVHHGVEILWDRQQQGAELGRYPCGPCAP